MATTEAFVSQEIVRDTPQVASAARALPIASLLTVIAVLIHGFHPYAEDGGIYLPGILKILHPDLYPTITGFVTAQTRFSLFARSMAEIVRISHIDLLSCVFFAYVASIWTMLYGTWKVLSQCYRQQPIAGYAGMSVMAFCLTMPIAGTSLLLMDPYLTARSFSTPCTVLAMAAALEILSDLRHRRGVRSRSIALGVLSFVVAAAMHPLMASYTAGCVLLIACASIRSTRLRVSAFVTFGVVCVAIASALFFFAGPEPAGYARVAQSRSYWFLANWQWYEVIGLIAPLMLLAPLALERLNSNEPLRCLAQMALVAGVIGIVISLMFAGTSARSQIVAMLQPLRIFLVVYIVLLLAAGAELGMRVFRDSAWRWTVLFGALGALMFFVQLRCFPNSAHLELPWAGARSGWEEGFRWVRDNTPRDAVIAMDANYILSAGEDAQNFRAIAERSMLPDYAKDGGIAAITPDLTAAWMYGESVQAGLDRDSDAMRRSKLNAAHINWLVLPSSAATAFPCPYKNGSMKVCRVTDADATLRAETNRPSTTSTRRLLQRKHAAHPVSIVRPADRDVSSAGKIRGQE